MKIDKILNIILFSDSNRLNIQIGKIILCDTSGTLHFTSTLMHGGTRVEKYCLRSVTNKSIITLKNT